MQLTRPGQVAASQLIPSVRRTGRLMATARAGLLATAALALLLTGCGGSPGPECYGVPSCPPPVVIKVTISAAGGGAVSSAAARVTGVLYSTSHCVPEAQAVVCTVSGDVGVYTLVIESPGFQSTQRTVTVLVAPEKCSCIPVNFRELEVALVRS